MVLLCLGSVHQSMGSFTRYDGTTTSTIEGVLLPPIPRFLLVSYPGKRSICFHWRGRNRLNSHFPFRRQTAEEREQERQAATKYFLSMQFGAAAAAAASAAPAPVGTPLAPPPPPPPGMTLPPHGAPGAALTSQGFHDVRNLKVDS